MKKFLLISVLGVVSVGLGAFAFWYFSNSNKSVSGVESINIDSIRPRGMKIKEVGKDYFVVSWNTDAKVSGYVRYGDTSNNLNLLAQDINGTNSFLDHEVRVSNLYPGKKYYFWVMSDDVAFGKDGNSLEVLTLSE